MESRYGKKARGVTLIEVMLVSVIISMMFIMYAGYTAQKARTLTIERASQQMQQLLNAGLSYYVANGKWPTAVSDMQPPNTEYVIPGILSPWTTAYTANQFPVIPVVPNTVSPLFQVSVTLPATLQGAAAIGAVLAGKLPYGTSTSTAPFTVTASVNLPGQNLNNATGINFAGVFHHGACVPVPACPPTDASGSTLTPEIVVSPSSISGVNDSGSSNVYPISSFTAYATGGTDANPPACAGGGGGCSGGTASGKYWRVCSQIVTSKGVVALDAGSLDTPIMTALTRCAVQNEPAGDPFNVFRP